MYNKSTERVRNTASVVNGKLIVIWKTRGVQVSWVDDVTKRIKKENLYI